MRRFDVTCTEASMRKRCILQPAVTSASYSGLADTVSYAYHRHQTGWQACLLRLLPGPLATHQVRLLKARALLSNFAMRPAAAAFTVSRYTADGCSSPDPRALTGSNAAQSMRHHRLQCLGQRHPGGHTLGLVAHPRRRAADAGDSFSHVRRCSRVRLVGRTVHVAVASRQLRASVRIRLRDSVHR